MTRNKIRFNHAYLKLRGAKTGILLSVSVVDKKLLHPYFLFYDTAYKENGETKNYYLKPGKYLVLLFWGDGRLFTTLRSAYPSIKQKYFRARIGQEFDIVISKPK